MTAVFPTWRERMTLDVAREFVAVDRELAGATGTRAAELAIRSMQLRHDLLLLCEEPCDCDEGTCPGLMTRSAS